MQSWKLLPQIASVAKYVECYWFLEKEPHDQSHSFPKLNPDPSCHLILTNDNQLYHYTHEGRTQVVDRHHLIFPHLKTFTMDHSAPFKIIGIKFKTGAPYSFKLADPAKYLDKVEPVEISQLFTSASFNTEQLFSIDLGQKETVSSILDEVLSAWILTWREDKHSELVGQIVPLLSHTAIAKIGGKLHRSQRTIERSFMKVTGFSMKQVHSMNRLEELLNYLYKVDATDINWADVANKYGFSDQPHLIRHLKNSIGNTPALYAKRRDLTIDIYGNFAIN